MDDVVAKTWTFSNDPAEAGCTMRVVPARRSTIERTNALAFALVLTSDNFLVEGGGECLDIPSAENEAFQTLERAASSHVVETCEREEFSSTEALACFEYLL